MVRLILMIIMCVLAGIFVVALLNAYRLLTSTPKPKQVASKPPPEKTEHQLTLLKIAANEHELGLLPHNDKWVLDICPVCIKEEQMAKQSEIDVNHKRDMLKLLESSVRTSVYNGSGELINVIDTQPTIVLQGTRVPVEELRKQWEDFIARGGSPSVLPEGSEIRRIADIFDSAPKYKK